MAKATKVIAPAVGVRGGRIAPLKAPVLALLKGGPKTVKAMAEKLKVSERDVRLAIDGLRAKGYSGLIKRVEVGTFAYQEEAKKGA